MSLTDAFSLKHALRRVFPSLLLNAFLPFIIYQMIRHFVSVSDLIALTMTMLPVLMTTLFRFFYKKKIDVLGALKLGSFTVCILLVFVTGNARFLLVRETMLYGAFSILCFLSLFFPQPIIFTGYKYLCKGMSSTQDQFLERLWLHTHVRVAFRRMTLVVSIVLIAVVTLHITLLFHVSIAQFLGITPIVTLPVDALLIAWIVRSIKSALHRLRGERGAL